MTKPVRLQLSRKKGFNLERWSREVNGLEAVNVARPSRWGNPFRAGEYRTPTRAVFLFHSQWLDGLNHPLGGVALRSELRKLASKNLACFCALDAPCHGDILLELANAPAIERATP